VPSALHGSDYFAGVLREHWWQTWRTRDGDPTASILRYHYSGNAGGKPSAGVAPTPTLEVGLADLDVAVSHTGQTIAQPHGEPGAPLKEGERIFYFLDIPETTNYPAKTLLATDHISYEGELWKCAEGRAVTNDPVTGLSSMIAELVKP